MPDEKLRIAIEALMWLRDHPFEDRDDAYKMRQIAIGALRLIQREHYLAEPSPVVHDLLAGVRP